MEAKIFFIPAFGTDSTIYQNIILKDSIYKKSAFIEWLPVNNSQNFEDYSKRLISYYKISEGDIVVGVSLGGLIAIEINKIIALKKIISISSLITVAEYPLLFKFLKLTKLYLLFSPRLVKFCLDLIIPFYGTNFRKYLWFRKVFKNSDNQFLRWSFKNIINWKNIERPENIVHIHGEIDPLFSIKNSTMVNYVIPKGSHAMIRFQAEKISKILNKEL